MVRNYIRKSAPSYDLATLHKAIQDVKNGLLNPYQASKKYGIPRTTIVDRVNNRRGVIKDSPGRPTAIDLELEKNLANGLKTMEKYGFGLTSKEMIELVGNFVKSKKLKTPFKENTPGYEWSKSFRKRHNMSLKKPQSVELSRKAACDPFVIEEYYDTLEDVINQLNLREHPERIWNLDESSFSKDPEKSKIIGARGYASTRTIASSGKENVTVLFTANAVGDKLPPLIIYKGKNIWDTWMSEQAFEGTTYAATKNGWIEGKVFEKYMFQIVLPEISKEGPALLVYDGHSTHIQLKILEKASLMGVTIVKLPSHASHLLQPLDLAVFKSMKDSWDGKLVMWQRLNVGKKLTKSEFSRLIGEVWEELDPKIIRNGFQKGGLYPLNKNAIPEDKFDADALQRHKNFKTKKDVPSLSHLCYKTLQLSIPTMISSPTEQTPLSTTSTSIQGTGREIRILEDRFLNESEKISFESLLLQKIKRCDQNNNEKRRKVVKGCEIITRDQYLNKLRKQEDDKQKKLDEIAQKKALGPKNHITLKKETHDGKPKKSEGKGIKNVQNVSKIKGSSSKTTKKRKKIEVRDVSESEEESDFYLESDTESICDWKTYCDDLRTTMYSDESREMSITDDKENVPDNLPNIEAVHEYEPDVVRRNPKTGDWIVVKFATKKTVKHFVGNVLSMIDNIVPKVKFLRKLKNSRSGAFHYPDVEDVSEIKHAEEDVVKFLENPEISRRGLITFHESLDQFNIQ